MVIHKIHCGNLFWNVPERRLIHRSTAELDRLLEYLATEKDSGKALDRMTEYVPLPKIEEATRLRYPEHINALQTAKKLYTEAKYFLQTTECHVPFSLRAKLERVLDILINILESVLNAFGIAEFFKPPENELHSDFKAQKITFLLHLFTTVSLALIPILGASLSGTILGGTMLAIIGLSLIYPLIRPASGQLPAGKNLTKEFRRGELPVLEGRKKVLDEMAQTLIASQNVKLHVMLLGESGVGKTEAVKTFIAAIERGDYPELKGKQVIYFNTADLINHGEMFSGGNRILEKISEAMGKNRGKYILVFDEIHMACQDKETSALADQMKTLLDSVEGGFPSVIAITTESEFFQDVYPHAAFARRFKRIAVENTSDAETIKILNNTFLKQAPKMVLEQGAMLALLQKTKEAFGAESPMPGTALKILSLCIQKTSATQKSPLEKRIESVREQIQSLYSQGAALQGRDLLPYARAQLEPQIEAELSQLETELKSEKKQLDRLFSERDRLAEMKKRVCQLAVKISEAKASQKEMKTFLVLSHYFAPSLEARVRAEAAQLGVRTVIDEELIDQIIAEERENLRKAEEAIARGRQQVAAREI